MTSPKPEAAPKDMGFLEHLDELRKRLVYCAIALLVAACLSFSYSQQIFEILSLPFYQNFTQADLIGTGPAEAFMLRLKVSLFAGLLLSCPIIFSQIWLFIAPGLHAHERKLIFPFVICTTALFGFGVWFCYAVVLPFTFKFFYEQYQLVQISPAIRMSEHLSMMVQALLAFGLVFEMPVLSYFLARVGVIDDRMLISGFRYAVVIIFIVAAVLTPPDVVTQFLMAVPLLILYGVSILVARLASKPSKLQENDATSTV